ncbi:tyrosinase family oxidase copper chaperone [Streptomyces sp. JH34]|uniref:tyrosinase family oxidase copper chaperone n=1 Tax=unclassified Streptomyces TaxID=2593676 RepID=UPI0023FA2DAA|nr:tyrosinase family oxidase copper chaperone [Streptomyces sp. JH34]MDF6022821.1 tyrosinase cofactor [Streptomyces sp. JH34]
MNPTSGTDEEPADAPRPARRAVLRTVFTAAALAGTGGALAPVLLQGQEPAGPGQGRDAVGPERFSELYKGREIRGTATAVVPAGAQPHAGAAFAAPAVDVSVDGRTLHVMRRADGSYLSTVNHYESFPTLLETARAAVDALGTAQLSAVSPHTI